VKKAGRPNLAGDAVHELKLLSCGRSGGRGSTPTTHYSSSAYEAPTNMFQISSAARVSLRQITHMCNCDLMPKLKLQLSLHTQALFKRSALSSHFSFVSQEKLCTGGLLL